MKDYFNDFDIWMDALKSIDMNESALPMYHGRMLLENQDVYMKMQKLTNCPRMIKCHTFIYNLDPENLTESEITEVNKLYDIAVNKGLVDDTITKDNIENIPVKNYVEEPVEKPENCCGKCCKYQVMYSACDNNGELKTGLAYSNSDSQDKAIQEVYNNLTNFNYHNISILGIECKEDSISFNNVYNNDDVYNKDDDIIKNCKDNYLNSMPLPVYEDEKSDNAEDKPTEEDDKPVDAEVEGDGEENKTPEEDDNSVDAEVEDEEDTPTEEDDDKSDDGEGEGESEEEKPEETEPELSDTEKSELRNEYTKLFKDIMVKCEFTDRTFRDLILDEKVTLLSEIASVWDKEDPKYFMSEEEEIQLYNITIKNEDGTSSDDENTEGGELASDVASAGDDEGSEEEESEEESEEEESEEESEEEESEEESEEEESEEEESEEEESDKETLNESQIIEAYLI